MIVKIYPENPDERLLKKITDSLEAGEIIIVPTDTIYAFCCDIRQQKAFEKICRIKQVSPEKATFSVVCQDMSHISEYTRQIPNHVFKALRKALPGPYTFILEANKNIPKIFHSKRSTVGIRITSDKVTQLVAQALGSPLVVSSVHEKDSEEEYYTHPELIHEKYEKHITYLIDGGTGHTVPSTVVDFTSGEAEIIREGAGDTGIF
jgi:tRNA threonylcarbamoyl adenosine modification protein (Sua5/YciO/YrdC/YwlC family)